MPEPGKPWLIRRSRAAARPREVLHDIVEVGDVPVYVILWETEHGQVLYLEALAAVAYGADVVGQLRTRLLDPAREAGAVLLFPSPVPLHRLAGEPDPGPYVTVSPARPGEAHPAPGHRHLAERIGRALGADLPIWAAGASTLPAGRAALAQPGRTVPLPDDSTWRRSEELLLRAVRAGLPADHPLAWAALAAEHVSRLTTVLSGHARLVDRGPGWYFAARPRPPQPAAELRGLLGDVAEPTELGEPAAREVIALQAAAGDMDRDDPHAAALVSAAERLSHLMFRVVAAEIAARRPRSPHLDQARAARPITATATWAGPVVQTWLRDLTPVTDLPAILRRRRIGALVEAGGGRDVRAAYRDRTGHYVLVLDGPVPSMSAEWQRGPAAVATWTEKTVLAADRPIPGAPAGPLLALTPGDDGTVRADPFPAALTDGGPLRLGFGDDRTGARPVLRRLLELALSADDARFATSDFVLGTLTEHPGMTLWPALTGPGDALRLRWETARAYAAADVAHVRRLLDPAAPVLYQYFAIMRDETGRPFQLVRRHATPAGFEVDVSIGPDGAWTHTDLLADIGRGKSYHEYRRLSDEEAARLAETLRAQRGRR